jgi:hypothetical protein
VNIGCKVVPHQTILRVAESNALMRNAGIAGVVLGYEGQYATEDEIATLAIWVKQKFNLN